MGGSRDLVVRCGASTAEVLAARSCAVLDAALAGDAELWITTPADEAIVLGAFQRTSSLGLGAASARPVVRRASGGAAVAIGPGTLHVVLALARPGALVPCDPARLVNRYVRPLLRALAKSGASASYFGRDWVSVAHRPVAAVGFAHDATTDRAAIEAFVAVTTPFAVEPRASFLGREPTTLATAADRAFELEPLARAIGAAYAAAYDREVAAMPFDETPARGREDADPPWEAVQMEAIGPVAAGVDRGGVLRVGGDFMASRDAVRGLEQVLADLPEAADEARIGAAVDAAFTAPGVALEGVRSLASLRDVVVAARARHRAR